MRTVFKSALVLAPVALAAATYVTGCSQAASGHAHGGTSSAVGTEQDAPGPLEFRNILYSYIHGSVDDDAFKKIVYLPTDALLSPNVSGDSAEDLIASYDAAFSAVRPSDLYDHGAAAPLVADDQV